MCALTPPPSVRFGSWVFTADGQDAKDAHEDAKEEGAKSSLAVQCGEASDAAQKIDHVFWQARVSELLL